MSDIEIIQEEPVELHKKCQKCNRDMPDGCIFYKHPKFGIMCEFCDAFKDGGIEIDPDH